MIIGQKSAKMDVGPHCFLNYSPKLKNLDLSTPKPQNIDIGQSFDNNESNKSPKKALPEQYYFCKILKNLTKVILLGQGLFLDFH